MGGGELFIAGINQEIEKSRKEITDNRHDRRDLSKKRGWNTDPAAKSPRTEVRQIKEMRQRDFVTRERTKIDPIPH